MIRDRLERPVRDLRLSVTDRCDLRCSYCMPHATYEWLKREEILSFEEIVRLTASFVRLGVEKVRLTGGEPLVRSDIDQLVAKLRRIDGLREIALTTNATRLATKATALRDAGLDRINVSLDTLDRETFQRITRRDGLDSVLAGIDAARDAGFRPIKINMVVERGVNDGEILPMLDYCRERGFALRFIEFMDVGNANAWREEKVVGAREILDIARARYAIEATGRGNASDTATRFRMTPLAGGEAVDVGIIASVTQPFCTHCSRVRVTAEGRVVTCLFSSTGTDVKSVLRSDSGDDELDETLRSIWRVRDDRYSEERLAQMRDDTYDPGRRSKIEMIRLGG